LKNYKSFTAIILFAVVTGFAFAFVQSNSLTPKIILPGEIKWNEDTKQTGRVETIVLAGDPQKEGLYTMRVKIPAGTKLLPHWHPENRTAVILSGTFYYSYGDSFNEDKLKEMPPGTFFTEPVKQPHFAYAKKGDVIIQVTGWGPTGTTQLNKNK
jgi:quercetin dioxygenase-like cupin family protein